MIRPATPADAAGIAAVYAPWVERTAASFEAEPPDGEEVRRRMLVAPRLPWLVAERDGRIVGWSCATPHKPRAAYRWAVETSVYLDQDETGRGTGRRLYQELLAALRGLGHVTALAVITLPNDPSVRLHERLGFRPVGRLAEVGFKHGAWRDVGWWQLDLRPRPEDPDEPTPWSPQPFTGR